MGLWLEMGEGRFEVSFLILGTVGVVRGWEGEIMGTRQHTVMILGFRTDRCWQTVQTPIRLFLGKPPRGEGRWVGRWCWGASYYFSTLAYGKAGACCACSRCGMGGRCFVFF